MGHANCHLPHHLYLRSPAPPCVTVCVRECEGDRELLAWCVCVWASRCGSSKSCLSASLSREIERQTRREDIILPLSVSLSLWQIVSVCLFLSLSLSYSCMLSVCVYEEAGQEQDGSIKEKESKMEACERHCSEALERHCSKV